MRFIADSNVGGLARRLRMAGFDALFFSDMPDNRLVRIALDEDRVLLTRDTEIMKRRVVSSGKLRIILIESDDVKSQLRQVLATLNLAGEVSPFTRCMECNEPLVFKVKEDIEGQVPPYVYQTQTQYMQCPGCRRIYWRGTHWDRMNAELEEIVKDP
ncbi:Mut7-C RNAse domain-containing protein [Chloroflexota bacterium]